MSSDLLNSLKDQADALTSDEKRLLATHLLEQAGAESDSGDSKIDLSEEVRYRRREYQWMKEHQQEYTGQWIALEGEKLWAHGSSARQVFEAARQAGATLPFIARIDSPDDLPFTGGW